MTALVPERLTGERCGEMLSQGMVSYRCEIGQGHITQPEDDPEPHYAREVGRTVRAWQAWRQRQLDRQRRPGVEVITGVVCPTCGSSMRLSDAHGLTAVCTDETCSQEGIPVAQPQGSVKSSADYLKPALAAQALRQRPGATAGWGDLTDLGRINSVDEIVLASCPRTVEHEHHFWEVKGEPGVYQCKGDLTDVPVAGERDAAFAATPEQEEQAVDDLDTEDFPETMSVASAPTKQREGDQPLPESGVSCVQDRIIAAMEESKSVGLQRYGRVLETFNGRKGIQDVTEEARDLFVYLTQIEMEAEATREQLEVVVASRIRPILEGFPSLDESVVQGLATLAVDSMMGWVVGQPSSGTTSAG